MQTWAIAYLVLYYSGRPAAAVGYTAVFAAILSFLMSPAAPASLLVFLQSSVMVNIAAARVSNVTIFLKQIPTLNLCIERNFILYPMSQQNLILIKMTSHTNIKLNIVLKTI